ncbi:MAG: hypothetical protein KBS79_03165 [Lachnospiraceae bacterium]|nr:hypothetical protein [Candidatus Minthocola equi]
MLRTDKPIYKVILILNLLFIAAGIVFSVSGIANAEMNTTRIISHIMAIACLAFAGFYIISGYRKNAAKYYKVYGALLAVIFLISILSSSVNLRGPIGIMAASLSLVIVLVLLLSENLGKTKSFVLCGLLVIINIIDFILLQDMSANVVITKSIKTDLTCLYGIMTYAKYLDKAERGTK